MFVDMIRWNRKEAIIYCFGGDKFSFLVAIIEFRFFFVLELATVKFSTTTKKWEKFMNVTFLDEG